MKLDSPQDIYDAALRLLKEGKSSFEEYINEEEFLVKSKYKKQKQVNFGYRNDKKDEKYNIITMRIEKETIHKNDPKFDPSKSKHVKVNFYKVDLSEYNKEMSKDEVLELLNSKSDEMEFVEKGWLHGHRLRNLDETLEELFGLRKGAINK